MRHFDQAERFWYKRTSETSQQQENQGSKITETKLSEEFKEKEKGRNPGGTLGFHVIFLTTLWKHAL